MAMTEPSSGDVDTQNLKRLLGNRVVRPAPEVPGFGTRTGKPPTEVRGLQLILDFFVRSSYGDFFPSNASRPPRGRRKSKIHELPGTAPEDCPRMKVGIVWVPARGGYRPLTVRSFYYREPGFSLNARRTVLGRSHIRRARFVEGATLLQSSI